MPLNYKNATTEWFLTIGPIDSWVSAQASTTLDGVRVLK